MSEIVPIEKTPKKGKKHIFYVEEVRCTQTGAMQAANYCKRCEHCRIYLGNKVKCSYADDLKRKEIKSVTGY